jgi:LysR family positive regulator for ilvC
MMDINDLELFKHLAGTLHFRKTALECNVSPSCLSRTIQRLEHDIGKKLLARDTRSVALTPAGLQFKEYCEDALTRFHLFKNSLDADLVLRGELTLYCSVTAILSILPRIIKRFRRTYPEVALHVQTGDAAQALTKVQTAEVDIAIAALPDRQPAGLEFIELQETPLVFIAPKFFPDIVIRNTGGIDWNRTPVIFPLKGLSRERAERWFADKNLKPTVYSQVAGNEAIIAMVSMGSGVGIVPRLVLEKSSLKNEVDVLDIEPALKPFIVGACTSRTNLRNPVVRSFWDIVRDEKTAVAGG